MFKLILLATIVCTIQGESDEIQEGWQPDYTFSYPFVVSVQTKNEDDPAFNHLCTGSIIKRQFILTSASCFDNLEANAQYVVRVGSRLLYDEGDIMEVEKLILHPEYKPGQKSADIALVMLKEPIKFRRQAQQINLPGPDFNVKGEGKVAGYGGLQKLTQQNISEKLHFAGVSVLSVEESKKYFNDLVEYQFAVGSLTSPNAPCQGTAGIPLIMTTNKRPMVVGLAQKWSESCEGPALFTDVTKYLDFILEFAK